MYYMDEFGTMHPMDMDLDGTGTYFETETNGQWPEEMTWDEGLIYVGKGKFRRKNPKGKDGKTLLCSGCGADDHFVKHCPRKNATQDNQQGQKTFVSAQSTWSTGSAQQSSSSTGSDWGSFIYMGGSQEIQHDSKSIIEFADGTVKQLESHTPEPETHDQPDQLSNPDEHKRHYYFPESSQRPPVKLSRSEDNSQQGTWARQFAFVWFMPAAFHAQVRLKDRGESLLVDVGAWDNLVGSQWVGRASEVAKLAGHGCAWHKLKRMLSVEGVGQKANEAVDGVVVPICLEDGAVGTFTSAVIPDSELPALLGLCSISKLKGLIDTHHKQIIFIGPGGYKLSLSPGSKVYQLHSAPTGHLMLPCQEWKQAKITPGKPGIQL